MKYSDMLEKEWQSLSEKVLTNDAPDLQRTEMRRAFFAGAAAAIDAADRIGAEDVSEEEACAILDGLHHELKRYRDDLEKGKA